jgi:hypothetical protein
MWHSVLYKCMFSVLQESLYLIIIYLPLICITWYTFTNGGTIKPYRIKQINTNFTKRIHTLDKLNFFEGGGVCNPILFANIQQIVCHVEERSVALLCN